MPCVGTFFVYQFWKHVGVKDHKVHSHTGELKRGSQKCSIEEKVRRKSAQDGFLLRFWFVLATGQVVWEGKIILESLVFFPLSIVMWRRCKDSSLVTREIEVKRTVAHQPWAKPDHGPRGSSHAFYISLLLWSYFGMDQSADINRDVHRTQSGT